MADHRTRHYMNSQRVTDTTCGKCGDPVIQFVEHGLRYHLDATQAPINRQPIDHHRAGRHVWRLNLSTGRWRYQPGGERTANPVHLIHDCPTRGRS